MKKQFYTIQIVQGRDATILSVEPEGLNDFCRTWIKNNYIFKRNNTLVVIQHDEFDSSWDYEKGGWEEIMEADLDGICPLCGNDLESVYMNNGYTMPEGPSMMEIVGYKPCEDCNSVDTDELPDLDLFDIVDKL